MQGIYYLLSIVAVFIVFVWYMRNDGLPEQQTRGLLAMKNSNSTVPETRKKRWRLGR